MKVKGIFSVKRFCLMIVLAAIFSLFFQVNLYADGDPGNDATLSTASTIKGVTIADLGIPSGSLEGSVTPGKVLLNGIQAADTSNVGAFITLFAQNAPGAKVKAVKYKDGTWTHYFETDAAYANEPISNNDFFIVKVTSSYNTQIRYYKIIVTVDAQAPQLGYYPMEGQIQAAGTKKAEVLVKADDSGMIYYIVSKYAPKPTVGQIMAGKDGYGDPAYASGSTTITANKEKSIIIDNLPEYSTTYDIWLVAVDSIGNMTVPYRTDIRTPGETAGSEAKLDYKSTIKGNTIGYYNTGTPASTIGKIVPGSAELTLAQAINETNIWPYITSLRATYAEADVKAVKYANGASTANFESDPAYANEPITNNDFFIIKVTSEDGSTVSYYKIIVKSTLLTYKLPQVTNVTLDETGTARWDDLANESGYVVQLFSDCGELGSQINLPSGTTSYNFLTAMRAAGEGNYNVTVMGKGDGISYTDGPWSTHSVAQTVIQLSTVSEGLNWDGDVAKWSQVPYAVSYTVQAYRDGKAWIVPVTVPAEKASAGFDFGPSITAAGPGKYTYKVTAKGNNTLILDAIAASPLSNENIKLSPISSTILSTASTIKGATISDLGAPNTDQNLVTPGKVTISATRAADTSNAGLYITLFKPNDPKSKVKAVKYANGASTANFEKDLAYTNQTIKNNDFFLIKVTAEDNVTISYYKVAVTVEGTVPSMGYYPDAGPIQAAGTKKVELIVKVNQSGRVYYVVTGDVDYYDPTPTKEQVLAGKNGRGGAGLASGSVPITANLEERIIIDNLPWYSTTYNVWAVAVNEEGNMSPPYRTEVTTPGLAAGSEAKLDYMSTIKGNAIGYYNVGTPASTIDGVTAGTTELTGTAAADETNAGSYITLFRGTYAEAEIKAVKYAEGASTRNFETDEAYANTPIANNDFFILKVTSEDKSKVSYYKIIVTVKP
ncbi:hypothetical protein [Clostridium sp. BNL1100]|uniref:hypothetical protein n=1 Tax=Clostridium sp. BNL1100 TaxID=755731 RepID=UPI00024A7C78|nr:hypothetical protein [Clostridium sp. BNL1100]AEY64948.1 hypothetical protein Clo1100_0677 [Clostridium sp. BNL1100]